MAGLPVDGDHGDPGRDELVEAVQSIIGARCDQPSGRARSFAQRQLDDEGIRRPFHVEHNGDVGLSGGIGAGIESAEEEDEGLVDGQAQVAHGGRKESEADAERTHRHPHHPGIAGVGRHPQHHAIGIVGDRRRELGGHRASIAQRGRMYRASRSPWCPASFGPGLGAPARMDVVAGGRAYGSRPTSSGALSWRSPR